MIMKTPVENEISTFKFRSRKSDTCRLVNRIPDIEASIITNALKNIYKVITVVYTIVS